MNSANASSLFHYTKKMSTLKSIIANGLRFSFAYETYPIEVVKAELFPLNSEMFGDELFCNGVAIPMISLCDIPISRSIQHIGKYGKCAIGLNKELLIEQFQDLLNPVVYVTSPFLKDFIINNSIKLSNEYRSLLDKMISISQTLQTQEELNKFMDSNEFKNLTEDYFKSHFPYMIFIGLIKPAYDMEICYYDEREWRFIYPDGNKNAGDWEWNISEESYQQSKELWNKELNASSEFFIKPAEESISEIITHIVVPKEKNIDTIIKLILSSPTILGCDNISYDSKLKIISKISSLERIMNNY